jgi:oligoribonuclease
MSRPLTKRNDTMKSPENLVWIDLEMTGLQPDSDLIIEIATIVTDKHLNVLAEGPVFAVHQSAEVLAGMDDWNRKQHGSSGLTERVLASRIDTAAAERETLAFLENWVERGRSPMCGNSICQDRRFLARRMPALERFFHYRNLDVSTLKELAQRWAPHIAQAFQKSSTHLALDDVRESIAELKFYRERFLRPL